MQQLLNEIAEALTRAEEELVYAQNALQPENLPELAEALKHLGGLAEQLETRQTCRHERVLATGGWHYAGGETFDDIRHVCAECGMEVEA